MALTPADIEAQVFRERFKGYDPDEVDAFLDRISSDLADMLREREDFLERIRSVEADAAESVEAERLLKRTLVTAQRTADETVAQAVAQAEATITEADQRAASLQADAEARAAQILGDAERDADKTREQARSEAAAARASVDEELAQARRTVADLQRFSAEYRDRVRGVVAEQLAMLDGIGEIPQVPAEMVRLADASEETDTSDASFEPGASLEFDATDEREGRDARDAPYMPYAPYERDTRPDVGGW